MNWQLLIARIPNEPGVYSIWAKGVLLYIGASRRMKYRLGNHEKRKVFTRKGADAVKFMLTGSEHDDNDDYSDIKYARFAMERWLINKHRPKMNSIRGVK